MAFYGVQLGKYDRPTTKYFLFYF